MKKTLFLAFLLSVSFGRTQDLLFTQLNSAPQYLNPALAGTDTIARVDMAYRMQWPKIGDYNTFYSGYQHYISKTNGYAAVNFMYDQTNALRTQRYSFQYAQNFRIGKDVLLRPAFEVTYVSKNLMWEWLTFGDMIDARRGFVYQTDDKPINRKKQFMDYSAGLLTYWKKLYLGLSVHHLTQPNESMYTMGYSPLPMKFGLQLGYAYFYMFSPKVGTVFMPYFNYTQQGNFNTFMAGLNLKFNNHILIGGGYRKEDAVLMNAGYQHKYFRIVYSFDYTTDSIGIESGGAHELSVSVFFWRQKAHKRYLKISLPT